MGEGSPEHKYDFFISYSRRDIEFVRRLHRALGNYAPPRDLPVPQRRLRVFRDESDFQGTEYSAAVELNLKSASKLLVISSPNSRASAYVGGEIRTFAELRGKANIISLLLAGAPNNDTAAEEAQKAFHEELISRVPIPLAADYRGFELRRDRVDRDRFESAWYKVIADVYADYNVDRNGIEQREKSRRRRTRRIRTAIVGAVIAALASLTMWAMISRQEAIAQRNTALSRLLAAESNRILPEHLDVALLLAAAADQSTPTLEARAALRSAFQRSPRLLRFLDAGQGRVFGVAAIRGLNKVLSISENGMLTAWNPDTGKLLSSTRLVEPGVTAAAFSEAGTALALGTEDGAVLVADPGTGKTLPFPTVHRGAVTILGFSQDGLTLASAGSDGTVAVWDSATGRRKDHGRIRGRTVKSIALSPDGERIAANVSGPRQSLVVFAVVARDGEPTVIAEGYGAHTDVVFGHDGKTLAFWDRHDRVVLWDVVSGRRLRLLRGPETWVTSLALDPHGTKVVTGRGDGAILL